MMETLVCIVLTILIPLLAANILRWLMPAECYVWFRARNRMLEQLLGLGVTTVIIFWGVTAGAMVWSLFTSSWDTGNIIAIVLYAAALPLGLVAAKLLMKKFWKPTPEMISHNDEMVKKEIAEMEKAAAEEAARKAAKEETAEADTARGMPPLDDEKRWVCPSCGKRNETTEYACTRCGRAYALWGQAAPLEDVEP